MDSLRTAIDVKNAIDSASSKLDSLGTCISHKIEWRCDHGLDDEDGYESNESNTSDSDTAVDSHKWGDNIVSEIDSSFHSTTKLFKNGYISETILNNTKLIIDDGECQYDGPISDYNSQALKLFNAARDAPFGDLKKMETVVDKSVRCAKDITEFTLDGPLVKEIERQWAQYFYPRKVRVEPYKINMYGPGSGFTEHRDTPSKNLVGTFLLGLGDSTTTKLRVKVGSSQYSWQNYENWDSAFYPDCPHQVMPFKKGLRSTMAFKIYAVEDNNDTVIEEVIGDNLAKIIELNEVFPSFGILLSHDYSLNSDQMKGNDALWYKLLSQLNAKIMIIPVMVKIDTCYYYEYESEASYKNQIYPLTPDHINYLMGQGDLPDELIDEEDVTFFAIGKEGYKWKYDYTSYCEHTGNECQPEEEDSIYLHRAMIVYK